MHVRKDQRGFTIVELLIAVAILSIVVASVCGFILVGSRSYASANSDINVQQEAQLSLNQMSDVLIDTTRSVTYTGYDAGGTTSQKALKDAEFTFTPEDKSLVMLNGVVEETAPAVPGGTPTKTVDSGNGNKHYYFYWSKQAETLYYAELDVDPGDVDPTTIASRFPAPPTYNPDPSAPLPAGWVELASHVTDFSVDLTQVEEKRVVQLALTFLDGKKEYVTSNNVTIRNKVGVNDAELAPLNKKKTLSVTPRDSGVILEPGETYHFSTPKVTGENVSDRSVIWSLAVPGGNSSTGGTGFTDAANGILQVATDEPAGTIDVVITTNAVDSDGNPASCTLTVYIKRVRTVTLNLTASSDAETSDSRKIDGNGKAYYEVSAGEEVTIGFVVEGEKLGVKCSGCGEDVSHDEHVVDWTPNADMEHVKVLEAGDCKAARYSVNTGTPVGTEITIKATSELAKRRPYGPVDGEIILKVVKSKETVPPLSGDLQYGSPDDDLHEDLKSDDEKGGLSTTDPRYVTCIRVVDNTGKQADKVLLHFTIGGGANIRIVPDMFDLDLNGSYTFYMQVLDVPNDGGVTDSKAEIWNEYINHVSKTRPYGYIGTKYDYRSVRYARLDKPKLTLTYKGVDYTGKQVTFDPLNVYMYGPGSSVISRGSIWPTDFYQIEKNKAGEQLTYSIYKDEGGKWTPIYYFDKESMSYKGDNKLKDDNNATIAEFNVRGDPFLKMENGNKQEMCGTYHIVPGITYDNTNHIDKYEYIGWEGFKECPYSPGATFKLTHEKKYYEFDDSTIHVELTDAFTMDIDHSDFKGQVMFPLPKEMKRSPLFLNINSLEWQTTGGKLTVAAKRDNSGNAENLTFNYVRYRYIKSDNAWEVEPIRHEYRAGAKKILVHSYGIYKCGENDKKWECIKRGGTTEKEFTIQKFELNGGTYRADFPLPTDSDFPFADGAGEIKRTLELFDSNMNQAQNVPTFLVSCKKNGDEYEIEFRTEAKANPYDANNHKINVFSYGIYTWHSGQTEWTRTKGYSISGKTDLVTNLEGVMINNTPCKMYFPLPSESKFPFKGDVKTIKCSGEHVAYAVTDIYGENAIWNHTYGGTRVEYTYSNNTHTINFINEWDNNKSLGTFTCPQNGTEWTKVN